VLCLLFVVWLNCVIRLVCDQPTSFACLSIRALLLENVLWSVELYIISKWRRFGVLIENAGISANRMSQYRSNPRRPLLDACCLIVYNRRPHCSAANSWDPKLISAAATWPGGAGVGPQRLCSECERDCRVQLNGCSALRSVFRRRSCRVRGRSTSLTTIAGIVCGVAARRRLPIRRRFMRRRCQVVIENVTSPSPAATAENKQAYMLFELFGIVQSLMPRNVSRRDAVFKYSGSVDKLINHRNWRLTIDNSITKRDHPTSVNLVTYTALWSLVGIIVFTY